VDTMNIRIGQGYDIHALVPGRPLVLGGVSIPHSHGLLGHSDADALAHALTDALLGGAGLGDIGRHFPDTDAQFAGADSMKLLAKVVLLVGKNGWSVVNADCTVIAQAPKLAPYVDAMAFALATCLAVSTDRVNVKAKTNENFDAVGQRQAISVHCVVLLAKAV
jgi:2-C-methyl-D-erythritol 2,4-cyclodiphosphate synthase